MKSLANAESNLYTHRIANELNKTNNSSQNTITLSQSKIGAKNL